VGIVVVREKSGQPMPTVRSLACAPIVHDQREMPSTII